MAPPTGEGFGSAVLEQVMAEYFENPPQIEFAADGVGYEVIGSLEAITKLQGSTDETGCREPWSPERQDIDDVRHQVRQSIQKGQRRAAPRVA